MERSREGTISKVDSMGMENLPSQVRSMIHPAIIPLLPAAFEARWSSCSPWMALTLINLPPFRLQSIYAFHHHYHLGSWSWSLLLTG